MLYVRTTHRLKENMIHVQKYELTPSYMHAAAIIKLNR